MPEADFRESDEFSEIFRNFIKMSASIQVYLTLDTLDRHEIKLLRTLLCYLMEAIEEIGRLSYFPGIDSKDEDVIDADIINEHGDRLPF